MPRRLNEIKNHAVAFFREWEDEMSDDVEVTAFHNGAK